MGWHSTVYWSSVVILPYFQATGVHLQLLRYYELVDHSFKWRPSAILDFKIRYFNCQYPSPSHISCRSVDPLWKHGSFLIFQAGGVWDYYKLEILTAGPVRRANMHQRVKFRVDCLNSCEDMAVFHFFKMATVPPVRHLGF